MSASPVVALARAAHLGPATAVTLLAGALGLSTGLSPARIAVVMAAVATGQLSVGWSNDLIDAARDRHVERTDKPLATGELTSVVVVWACALAVVATVILSLLCGVVAGLVHVGCVGAAWAYNLGLKSTPFSWVPYALAFGGLTVFVVMTEPGAGPPPVWMPIGGALLGIGAHLVNTLPDLVDDEATGVRGLPHRLGERGARALAVGTLALASVVIASGSGSVPTGLLVLVLVTVGVLGCVAFLTQGRTPFWAAVGIAVADVVLLLAAR